MPSKKSKRKNRTKAASRSDPSEYEGQQQNAAGYESEQDSHTDALSESEMILEAAGREPVKPWVKNAIREVAQATDETMIKEFFLSGTHFADMGNMLMEMNNRIRTANQANGYPDDYGSIPMHSYEAMCKSWFIEKEKPEVQENRSVLWKAFDKTYTAFENFNQVYGLPLGWNISASELEREIGTRPITYPDLEPELGSEERLVDSESDDSESDEENLDSKTLTALDRLEARAREEASILSDAKVLYWWSKGVGSQTFVRYGSNANPVYRIRAGTYENFDKKKVPRVLASTTRGSMKVLDNTDGIPGEKWKYGREDVYDIIGVGWKVEDDDDEQYDPLDYILPGTGVKYPETRVLVRWADGAKTLETRTFIRRIINGSNLNGDRLIYQKAKELEENYRNAELADEEDDTEEVDADEEAKKAELLTITAPARATAKTPVNIPARATAKIPAKLPAKAPVKAPVRGPSPPVLQKDMTPQSTAEEDPRNLEIRQLREQLDQINAQSQLQTKRGQFRNARRRQITRNDEDGVSTVSSKPPILPLRRSRRYGLNEPFDGWS